LSDRFRREAIDLVGRIEALEVTFPKGPRPARDGR
jgi:hypothetical protein